MTSRVTITTDRQADAKRVAVELVIVGRPESTEKLLLEPGEALTVDLAKGRFLLIDELEGE